MELELKRLSVVGLGKLGAPLAACFASKGFPTIGLDLDPHKVEALNRGVPPVYEPGLQDLFQECRGRLSATSDYEKALGESDVTFIPVPTPNEKNHGFSLKYVLQAAEKIGGVLRNKRDYYLAITGRLPNWRIRWDWRRISPKPPIFSIEAKQDGLRILLKASSRREVAWVFWNWPTNRTRM